MPKAPKNRYWGDRDPATKGVTALYVNEGSAATAEIRLYDPIDSWGEPYGVSAKDFAAALDAVPDAKTIQLRINSPGGEVWEAMAIVNLLRNHPADVHAYVDGIAASAASFIAAAADVTVMGRNTQMMIHDARGISIGAATDMHSFGDLLDKISDNIADVYASKAGGDVASWRALMLAETWYSADEAVAAGLADSVDPGKEAEPTDKFDLSIFDHAGRQEAPEPASLPPTPAPVAPVMACGCGPDLPGIAHKDECLARARASSARARALRLRERRSA